MAAKRGILAATAAVAATAAASAVTVTLFTTPSHAITIPPPGQDTLTVRNYYEDSQSNIIGQMYLAPCPGAPLPANWGVNTGRFYLSNLPCSGDPGKPKPSFPFPTGTPPVTDPFPGGGF